MTTTPLPAARRGTGPRRYSRKEQLLIAHQEQLLALVRDRMPDATAQTVDAVIQGTWTRVLRSPLRLTSGGPALPQQLRAAAGEAISQQTARDSAELELVELLGPGETWPAHWHEAHREGGRLALLHRAAGDIETGAVPRPLLATAA
jgi:hypothetical protein